MQSSMIEVSGKCTLKLCGKYMFLLGFISFCGF
jgi:hypothetical protein